MNTDFIPRVDALLLVWCIAYKTEIAIVGPKIGMTDEEIAAEIAICEKMIAAITDVNAKKTAQTAAVKLKVQVYGTDIAQLRSNISRHKTNPLVTADIQKLLDIAPKHSDFDGGSYKAAITAELIAGVVRLKFKKLGADGINMYHRKKGNIQWLFLVRATKSPFDDHITLATPSQPEHWEYRAFGVEADLEIGQPSDIIEIVFGG